jgi:hypothetical protein
MPRGYAEGPAAEAAEEALERGDHTKRAVHTEVRKAVWGSTADNPEAHRLGELGEVDPDELFASGRAWGIYVTSETA